MDQMNLVYGAVIHQLNGLRVKLKIVRRNITVRNVLQYAWDAAIRPQHMQQIFWELNCSFVMIVQIEKR